MSEKKHSPSWLRAIVEYVPLATFFVAYYFTDLFIATASIMLATAFTLVLSYIVERRIPIMPLMMAGIIGIFGGLTLWLQDETFIKMKPTIIQVIFGTVLFTGLLLDRLFLKSLIGAAWQITDEGWRILTMRFAMFFFLSAIVNEAVWRTQSTDLWVNFKVFGLTGMTLIFILSQLPLLKRFSIKENSISDSS
jgi:intracellular septation protein|tara:strand:+ start:427 stop:1005 length:579 start_codon:yes stop_codon:yes gene_type:complete